MLYAVEHTGDMDIAGHVAGLAAHMQDVIDVGHLGAELQRKPIVQSEDGAWRALTQPEAIAVVSLVGEAIGIRWGESLR